MINSLIQSKFIAEKKNIKILVTGPTTSVDSLMDRLVTKRSKLNSGRYYYLIFYLKKKKKHDVTLTLLQCAEIKFINNLLFFSLLNR